MIIANEIQAFYEPTALGNIFISGLFTDSALITSPKIKTSAGRPYASLFPIPVADGGSDLKK